MAVETFVINPPELNRRRIGIRRLRGFRFPEKRRVRMLDNYGTRAGALKGWATRRRRAVRLDDNPSWFGESRRHAEAAKLGWRRRKGLLDDNPSWWGEPRRHAKAAKLAWRRHRPTMLRGVRLGAARRRGRGRKLGSWRAYSTKMMRRYGGRRGLILAGQRKRAGRMYLANPDDNAWVGDPAGHRRAALKGWARRRRRYDDNPRRVRRSRGFLDNPAVATAVAPLKTLTDIKGFWLGTFVPITAGAIGAKLIGDKLGELIFKKEEYGTKGKEWQVPVMTVGTGIVASALIGMLFKKPDLAAKVLMGSAIGALLPVLTPLAQKLPVVGKSGLGEDLTPALKEKIAESIKKEIAKKGGVSAYVTKEQVGVGDFVTKEGVEKSMSGFTLDDMIGEPVFNM